jgi:leucine dehydrogenase
MGKYKNSLIFRDLNIEGYERVVEVKEPTTGLHAIISLHNTNLGPALGGTRAYPYSSFDEALTDVLRLSEGMTYKSAIAQTGTGGGKSVIILQPGQEKSEEMLLAFGEAVNHFEGRYICAEDVGISIVELTVVNRATKFAVGLTHAKSSGDPSRFTARGGFQGVRAVAKTLWGSTNLKDKVIAIQGLGAVGMKLAHSLFWEGAKLIVTDIDPAKRQEAVTDLGAIAVLPEEIYSVGCDIFSPCAMGGILNELTIPKLKCKGIAGVSNNQLLTENDGEELMRRGILYAPDFAINAGGLINVCAEIEERGYCPILAREKIDRLYDLLLLIFTIAKERGESTAHVARAIAEDHLKRSVAKRIKSVVFH